MSNYLFMIYLLVMSIVNIWIGSTPPYTIVSGMNVLIGALCFFVLSAKIYMLTER